uniref:LITAF domain-containing protein n=1 Tax=Steinernema glaseri TaxID=37863 RepID=A0A1I7YN29_9BILA
MRNIKHLMGLHVSGRENPLKATRFPSECGSAFAVLVSERPWATLGWKLPMSPSLSHRDASPQVLEKPKGKSGGHMRSGCPCVTCGSGFSVFVFVVCSLCVTFYLCCDVSICITHRGQPRALLAMFLDAARHPSPQPPAPVYKRPPRRPADTHLFDF